VAPAAFGPPAAGPGGGPGAFDPTLRRGPV